MKMEEHDPLLLHMIGPSGNQSRVSWSIGLESEALNRKFRGW